MGQVERIKLTPVKPETKIQSLILGNKNQAEQIRVMITKGKLVSLVAKAKQAARFKKIK